MENKDNIIDLDYIARTIDSLHIISGETKVNNIDSIIRNYNEMSFIIIGPEGVYHYGFSNNQIGDDIFSRSVDEYLNSLDNQKLEGDIKFSLEGPIPKEHCPEENCTICLESLTDPEKEDVFLTDCDHFFHKSCIYEWARNKQKCPLCRKEIKYFFADLEKKKEETESK